MKIENNEKNNKNGFTVLYAVLISSLLLSIGASIYNLSIKDIILTGSVGESQRAIYAADSAVECAFFWDLNITSGEDSSFASSTFLGAPPDVIKCSNTLIDLKAGSPAACTYSPLTTFSRCEFSVIFSNTGACINDAAAAKVSVERIVSDPVNFVIGTTITADGFSSCDTTVRRVQRTLRVTY